MYKQHNEFFKPAKKTKLIQEQNYTQEDSEIFKRISHQAQLMAEQRLYGNSQIHHKNPMKEQLYKFACENEFLKKELNEKLKQNYKQGDSEIFERISRQAQTMTEQHLYGNSQTQHKNSMEEKLYKYAYENKLLKKEYEERLVELNFAFESFTPNNFCEDKNIEEKIALRSDEDDEIKFKF